MIVRSRAPTEEAIDSSTRTTKARRSSVNPRVRGGRFVEAVVMPGGPPGSGEVEGVAQERRALGVAEAAVDPPLDLPARVGADEVPLVHGDAPHPVRVALAEVDARVRRRLGPV